MNLRTFILMVAISMFTAGICSAQTSTVSDCPDDFVAFAETTEPLACSCSAEAAKRGYARGMDIYTANSSVCLAAVHAGVISPRGGPVTVVPEAGRKAYPGVTRNGITSHNNGAAERSFRFAGSTQGAPTAGSAPSAAPPQGAAAAGDCPDDFVAFAETTEPLACSCSAEAAKRGYARGMDIYTANSSVCLAAVHAGVISPRGGPVTVVPEAGRKAYPGVTRNGVTSHNNGAAERSFRFAGSTQGAPTAGSAPSAAPPQGAAAAGDCPDDFVAFAETTEPLACSCSAEAAKRGYARGMDIYTANSSVCLAAVHAGVISPRGGPVTVVPEAGRKAYPGVTRNGVTSHNNGAAERSFRFAGSTQGAPTAPSAARPQGAAAAGDCPDDFVAFAETTEPLACSCSAEATNRGYVRGMDVYTANSSVCRAAVHAGAASSRGGAVTVIPEAGRNAYAGVTRNGITSYNNGAADSSFRFAVAARPVMIGDKPAQQPIASTIQATGQVQLYIQFRFNSADLDESAAPTLMELRDAINAAPNLRLMLVGHTDAIGTPQYNKSLSLRRAQSVMSWLTAQGVPPNRLAVDGKGQDQPIADNGTDAGRALNRRVQALRVK